MYIVLRWVAHALILWFAVATGKALGLDLQLRGFWDAAITVFLLALANAFIRPIMKTFLMPLNCLTLGLFGFAVSILLLWIVSVIVPGFSIGQFRAAVYCALVMGILGGIANGFIRQKREN